MSAARRPWSDRTGRRRRARLTLSAAILAMAVSTVPACVSPRNTLGTSSSPCFRAVAVATDAVHDRGRLAGVRLVGVRELDRHPHLRDLLATRVGNALHNVCVVSFHGTFRPDQVEHPLGDAPAGGSGPVALVVVAYPGNTVIGTFVVTREPLPIRHEV